MLKDVYRCIVINLEENFYILYKLISYRLIFFYISLLILIMFLFTSKIGF